MSFPIEAKVLNTEKHFIQANLWHSRYLMGKARRVFMWGCMAVTFVLGVLALGGSRDLRIIGIWAVIFPAIMAVSVFIVRPYRLRKIFREIPDQGSEVIWRFFDETIEVSSKKGRADFRWDAVVRAGVTECGVSLFPQKNMSHWIPASAFATPEDFERFASLVKSRVPKTKSFR